MRFEWDAQKDDSNRVKHGIDFATATRVFSGPLLTAEDVRRDYGERRFASLGEIDGVTLLVIWTERGADTVRLISARRANAKETRRYRA
jgi:uncharacterized protein